MREPDDGGIAIRARAKLFWNGRSQAVRLPKEFRFEGDEGWVETGDNSEIVLSPNLAKSLRRTRCNSGN